jgi:hypothetical protein
MPSINPAKSNFKTKSCDGRHWSFCTEYATRIQTSGDAASSAFQPLPVRLACASPQSSPASSGHKNARCMYVPISKSQFDRGCGGSSVPRPTVPKLVLLHLTESDRTAPAILVSRPRPLHVRLPRLETKGKWTHWEIIHLLCVRFEEQLILECVHERKGFRQSTGILKGGVWIRLL